MQLGFCSLMILFWINAMNKQTQKNNVTKHSLNRAWALLFWEENLLHVSLWQLTLASTSKLYSYNTSIENPKFNVSDASRRLFSWLFKRSKHASSYRGQNYSECMTEIQGKSILVRVSEGSSYRESTVYERGAKQASFSQLGDCPGSIPHRFFFFT